MMRGRRNLVQSAGPNSLERVLRNLARRVQKIERAPGRQTIAVVAPTPKAVAPTVVTIPVAIFASGMIYRIETDTWELIGNSGDDPSSSATSSASNTSVAVYKNPSTGDTWVSTDRGATWATKIVWAGLSVDGDSPVTYDVSPNGTIWVLNNSSGAPLRIYRSTDSGDTWENVLEFMGTEVADIHYMAASPTDNDRVAALAFADGLLTVVVSVDGGDTWSSQVEVSSDCRSAGVLAWFGSSHLAIVVDEPALGSIERHKLYVSDDDGATWTAAIDDAETDEAKASGRAPTYENGILIMPVIDKAYQTTDGSTWTTITPPIGSGGTPGINDVILVNGELWTLTLDGGGFYLNGVAKADAPIDDAAFVWRLTQI